MCTLQPTSQVLTLRYRDIIMRIQEVLSRESPLVDCVYLCPCIYLGPSLQQQSHHVAVPTFGCYVQWCYVILQEEKSNTMSLSGRDKKT